MSRSVRLLLAAIVYLAIVGGLFAALWARDGSDDYAGWAPAIAGLALPACLVIAFRRERLGWAAAATLGVPAALCLGGVTLLMMWPALEIHSYSDGLALLGLLVLGPGAVIVMTTVFLRRLVGQHVRVGARRVVAIVAAAGSVAVLATSGGWWGFWELQGLEQGAGAVFFLMGALPLAWSIGPALALLATHERGGPR